MRLGRMWLSAPSLLLTGVVTLAACSGGDTTGGTETAATPAAPEGTVGAEDASQQQFPDVLAAELSTEAGGTYSVSVTMSSPYDTPERYADGWRVLAPDGTELGSHTLAHDHANEQPFTRRQTGLEIPSDVTEVTVQGRDQQYGYGGGTVSVPVPDSTQ